MPTVVYLSNLFPSSVEPYVIAEIEELRRRGIAVIACSARRPKAVADDFKPLSVETLCLQPIHVMLLPALLWLCWRKRSVLADFCRYILSQKKEPRQRRLRAALHTLLGAYFAVLLKNRAPAHIHVHHGYFSSWIGMVAARLLGIDFSLTLHGSDLLVHPHYLELKLRKCKFCVTVSDFNRRHILEHYPQADPGKILVRRMGVECQQNILPGLEKPARPGAPKRGPTNFSSLSPIHSCGAFVMLAVGRLSPVKDHAFLLRACSLLRYRGANFVCLIAGEGPERANLEQLIQRLDLGGSVRLLGHVPHRELAPYYTACSLVVLTSRSEGIPLVLMEAMAYGKPVLAPAITGIPELVIDGETGFLYSPGSLEDFVESVQLIRDSQSALDPLRRAARQHVFEYFNQKKNLAAFCDLLEANLSSPPESDASRENPLLQQI